MGWGSPFYIYYNKIMEILRTEKSVKYCFDKNFSYKYLIPVSRFVQTKLAQNNWDDYNELYHAVHLAERLKKETDIWCDTHFMLKDDSIAGVLLILGGKINTWGNRYWIENEEVSLFLKYFHITNKGQGYGSFWLDSVIIPYYKDKGYRNIYVHSSHEKSFPFYNRYGSEIATYEQMSDNALFKREGKIFLIII